MGSIETSSVHPHGEQKAKQKQPLHAWQRERFSLFRSRVQQNETETKPRTEPWAPSSTGEELNKNAHSIFCGTHHNFLSLAAAALASIVRINWTAGFSFSRSHLLARSFSLWCAAREAGSHHPCISSWKALVILPSELPGHLAVEFAVVLEMTTVIAYGPRATRKEVVTWDIRIFIYIWLWIWELPF
jgi:hypothetical protein